MPQGIYIKNAADITAQLSGAIRSMSRLTGFSEKAITQGLAGRILKKWAGYTKLANPGIVDRNARLRALRSLDLTKANPLSINVGIRGQAGLEWYRTQRKQFILVGAMRVGGAFLPSNKFASFSTGKQTDIREAATDAGLAMNREMAKGERASGLARQSVIQIADSIGIRLESVPGSGLSPAAVAKARMAIATDGMSHVNGYGSEDESNAGKYFVSLVNQYPWQAKAGIDSGLLRAMSGEVGYFRQNMNRGVFDSLQNTARAYPWMKLQFDAAA